MELGTHLLPHKACVVICRIYFKPMFGLMRWYSVLSIIFRLTITVIQGDTGREERVHHDRELNEVDIVLVLTRRGHYSTAGKFSFPTYTHCLQSLIFSIFIHYCFTLYISIIHPLIYATITHSKYHLYTKWLIILLIILQSMFHKGRIVPMT